MAAGKKLVGRLINSGTHTAHICNVASDVTDRRYLGHLCKREVVQALAGTAHTVFIPGGGSGKGQLISRIDQMRSSLNCWRSCRHTRFTRF